MWSIRVGVFWVAVHHLSVDLPGVWQIMMLEVLVQVVAFLRLHFRGDWLEKEVS